MRSRLVKYWCAMRNAAVSANHVTVDLNGYRAEKGFDGHHNNHRIIQKLVLIWSNLLSLAKFLKLCRMGLYVLVPIKHHPTVDNDLLAASL